MTSSGYGSQAVSTLTLSSEDSGSIKSIEETPADPHSGHPHNKDKKRLSAGSDEDSETVSRGVHSFSAVPPNVSTSGSADSTSAVVADVVCDSEDRRVEEEEDLRIVEEEGDAGTTEGEEESGEGGDIDDLYSMNAMEELEKLGEGDRHEDESFSTSSPFPAKLDAQANRQTHKQSNIPTSEAMASHLSGKPIRSSGSFSKRRGSGMRSPRPSSMIVSPADADPMTLAWQEDVKPSLGLLHRDDLLGSEFCLVLCHTVCQSTVVVMFCYMLRSDQKGSYMLP